MKSKILRFWHHAASTSFSVTFLNLSGEARVSEVPNQSVVFCLLSRTRDCSYSTDHVALTLLTFDYHTEAL